MPVDPARVYAAGYSGGATYLGWYVPTFPERFAAVLHIAGGVPWGTPCPRCPVHVLFTLGAGDPMLVPYTRPLRDYYEGCGGNEVVWETLPGVSHEGILGLVQGGKGDGLLAWLLSHRATCAETSVDAGSAGAAEDAGAIAEAWREPRARRFTVFVFVSMFAYSAQDLILSLSPARGSPSRRASRPGCRESSMVACSPSVPPCAASRLRGRRIDGRRVGRAEQVGEIDTSAKPLCATRRHQEPRQALRALRS